MINAAADIIMNASAMLLSPQGAQMVIYCTYDKDNSSLVSRHRYVVAQNNNLSDRINIRCVGMSDPAAYGYYIDFVCVTHGGAAKAAYSSPALEYGEDGLNFDIPNCLTQYEGYVEAQLVIYEKSRESVVAKSVGRTGGIFEVAASVNSLETRVIEPANMLTELSAAVLTADNLNTEVAKTVEEARQVKEDIENTLASLDGKLYTVVEEKMLKVVKTLPMATVEFYFYDRRVASSTVVQGKPVPEPDFEAPEGTILSGWYSIEKGRHWDFENDVVGDKNICLYADCRNDSEVSFQDGELKIGTVGRKKVYLPFTYEEESFDVVRFDEMYASDYTVYVNDREYKFVNMAAKGYITSYGNTHYKGGRYLLDKNDVMVGVHLTSGNILELDFSDASNISLDFSQGISINDVVVKSDLKHGLNGVAKGNYMIFSVVLKGNVSVSQLGDFFNLQAILLISDTPELMKKFSYTSRNQNCKIYVPSHYIEIYRNNPEWEGVELYPLEEYKGHDYTQIIYPTPEEFV